MYHKILSLMLEITNYVVSYIVNMDSNKTILVALGTLCIRRDSLTSSFNSFNDVAIAIIVSSFFGMAM